MEHSRVSAAALSAAAILCVTLAGGTIRPAAMTAAERADQAQERTTRLQIDFIALQADGTPARQLAPEDLELRVDGRQRQIRSLRRVTAAAAPVSQVPAPYGTSVDTASGRTFVLVVDQDSFAPGRERPLRDAVNGLMESLGEHDYATLVTLPYGGVVAPMSNDHGRIMRAVAGITGQRSSTETGSQMACRTRIILESVENYLSDLRGRVMPTSVILFTGGLAAPRRDAPMALAPGMCELQSELFRRVGVAAGAARANFFVAQPDDIAVSRGANESISGAGYLGSDNPLEGIEHLAGVTRAERVPLVKVGTGALARIAEQTSAYWVAEIDAQPNDRSERSVRLDIRAVREGVTVHARPEITFVPPPASVRVRGTVAEMLVSQEAFSELPLHAAAFTVAPPTQTGAALESRVQVVAVIEPGERGTRLTSAGAVLVDKSGTVVGRWNASDANESPLMGALLVPPGQYRLRAAAVDSNGRAGAVDYPVDASLVPVGALRLGALVMGLSRDGQLSPRLSFGDEPAALAAFDIYGSEGDRPVRAVIEVARSLDGPAVLSIPLTLTRLGAVRYMAIGTVPLGALPAGDYVVRGTVSVEGGASGRTVRTLRKETRQP